MKINIATKYTKFKLATTDPQVIKYQIHQFSSQKFLSQGTNQCHVHNLPQLFSRIDIC